MAAAPVEAEAKARAALRKGLEKQVVMVERAVESSQPRWLMRVLKFNGPLRKALTADEVAAALKRYVPEGAPLRAEALAAVEAELGGTTTTTMMMVETASSTAAGDIDEEEEEESRVTETPEVGVYLVLLAAQVLCREGKVGAAATLAAKLVERARVLSARRTLDPFTTKIFALYAWTHEQVKKKSGPEMRATLFAAHRTACLRHNEAGQATVLNALLRSLLEAREVEVAQKLVAKATFPENASNNQFCRYLYYTGRIAALRLDYTEARAKLMQSVRKAPANTAGAFKRAVQKLTVIVELLMGDVPERAMFQQEGDSKEPKFASAMRPYLDVTRAVRKGSLLDYTRVLAENRAAFQRDGTETLVVRLAQNVVKTGLRRLNTSYSRISLHDIKVALELDSESSAEFVAAKAIADGLIDAVLDHDGRSMKSNDVADLYATNEPQRAFHRRIAFCLDVHNEAVKAMVYPKVDPNKANKDADDADPDAKNPDKEKSAEEVAKEIEDELDDDDGL